MSLQTPEKTMAEFITGYSLVVVIFALGCIGESWVDSLIARRTTPVNPYYCSFEEPVQTTPVASFQTNGEFSISTFASARPSIGFQNYTLCVRMFLVHYRGSYNTIIGYGGTGGIPDAIFIGADQI